ncbi:hypothetical protein UM654_10545 [Staphylococcus aureus]|nr:hypothetical protein UM654_10545 [Staphylococcus aureus]
MLKVFSDKAHGQNMTKAQVEAALNQVTTAKNALNGDANVRQAKSDAKANLGTLTHLNNAQKTRFNITNRRRNNSQRCKWC